MIEEIGRELVGKTTVILTGGVAPLLARRLRRVNRIESDLTLIGIRALWEQACR